MAHNESVESNEEWKWLSKMDVDIENFHIKSASISGEYLLIFARGQPRDVYEQCCSFLLMLKLIIQKGKVTDVDKNYHYLKLDPIVYAQFAAVPFFARRDQNTVLRVL